MREELLGMLIAGVIVGMILELTGAGGDLLARRPTAPRIKVPPRPGQPGYDPSLPISILPVDEEDTRIPIWV